MFEYRWERFVSSWWKPIGEKGEKKHYGRRIDRYRCVWISLSTRVCQQPRSREVSFCLGRLVENRTICDSFPSFASIASVVGWERSWKVRVHENRRNTGSRRIKKKGRKEWTVHFPLFSCGTSLFPPKVTRATRPLEELLNPRHFTGGSAQSWSCFLPFARVSSTHGTYRIKRRQQYLGINFPDAWEMRRTAVSNPLGTASATKLQAVG